MDFVRWVGTLLTVMPPPDDPKAQKMIVVARHGSGGKSGLIDMPVLGMHLEQGKLVIEL